MKSSASLRKPVLATLAVALGAAVLPAQSFAAGEAQWVPGRLLVQPRAGLPEAEFDKILKKQGGKQIGKIEGINVRVVQLPPQASEKAVEALLKRNKHLKNVERDMLVPHDSTNDPYYGNAWHLPKIGAPTAWSTTVGSGVTIAVLDSGVNSAHPDLAGKLLPGWNFYDANSNTADVTGHGTKVAGTAAAASNNALGVASVAGGAMILPGRISDSSGYATFSKMAAAVTWAADNGARVANLSYSGARGSTTVQSAGQYLKNKGGLLIVSGGNAGVEETAAPSDALIAVSATTSSDVKASWSSYGSYIDVAAPGASIYTTTKGGGYGSVSGTSFASPATAGVVALMMAANPALSPDDVAKHLFATAVDLGTAGFDNYYGHGRIDAAAAVEAVKGSVAVDTAAPTASVVSPTGGSTVKGVVTVDIGATDNVGVSRVELLINGSKIASDTTAPYAFSWDSTNLVDGDAKITAQAYDAAGNSASHSVTVTVANNETVTEQPVTSGGEDPVVTDTDTTAPRATIGNPTDGSKVNGHVSVTASASDDVGVTSLRLLIDGKVVATAKNSNLSYRWRAKDASVGTHTITVEAFDAANNVGRHSVSVVR